MNSSIAAKRIQRFFHNYVHWEYCTENGDEKYWPIDPIMDEPFDPSYKIRILNQTNNKTIGKKHKVQVFNVATLWQSMVISHNIENPLIENKFTKKEFMRIADLALKKQVVSENNYHKTINEHFPDKKLTTNANIFNSYQNSNLFNHAFQKKMKKIRKEHRKMIKMALLGDNSGILSLLIKNGDNIDNDKLLPNKFISLNKLKQQADDNDSEDNNDAENENEADFTTLFPSDIEQVCLLDAIAYGCDNDTFNSAMEMGCDPLNKHPVTKTTCYHFAALANNYEVLQTAKIFDENAIFQESTIGTPLSLVSDSETLLSVYFTD